jgi:putative transcriptional regulator
MKTGDNLTGSLLVAHPCLRDPNFCKTIIFVSEHSSEEGATGFVLNRPLQTSKMKETGIRVFFGGPVCTEQTLLASLQWRENPTIVAFRAFLEPDHESSREGWERGLRIFEGCSGWSPGQLEQEIEGNTWLVMSPTRELIEMNDPDDAWKNIMRHSGPFLHLLSEAPDDPGVN